MEQLIIRIAIRELHRAGMISCIKFVRSLTYKGLKESKTIVEDIMSEMNLTFPQSTWQLENDNIFLKQENFKLSQELNDVKEQLRRIIEG